MSEGVSSAAVFLAMGGSLYHGVLGCVLRRKEMEAGDSEQDYYVALNHGDLTFLEMQRGRLWRGGNGGARRRPSVRRLRA
jgi:hypothetical protein